MKTIIIAVSVAAFIAAAPTVTAQGLPGKAPDQHHKVSRKHHPVAHSYARFHEPQVGGAGMSYRGAFGYTPDQSRPPDRDIELSRQAGGGGGGGGGGGM